MTEINKKAFTLAEILMVLVIIGIIAAMTIPSLVQNFTKQKTTAKVKTAYAALSSAYNTAIAQNGSPETWGWTDESTANSNGAITALNVIIPNFKILKKCDTGKGCFPPSVTYKRLDGANSSYGNFDDNIYRAKAQLTNGNSIILHSISKDCSTIRGINTALKNVCGDIAVDINGFQQPNKFGEDVFFFYLTKYGVLPYGTHYENWNDPFQGYTGVTNDMMEYQCNINSTNLHNGIGCAAWVIYKENMDYLTREVDWSE